MQPSCAVQPLIALLHQLFDLVESLSADEYTQKPVGVVESSIGGHVRHNLNHIEALLRSFRTGELSFDHRDRDTAVEHDRVAALSAILRLANELTALSPELLPTQLTLSALIAPELPPIQVVTSSTREFAFVISHTIHHNAIIRVMVKLLGIPVPDDFGYAPSTILHHRSRSCAR